MFICCCCLRPNHGFLLQLELYGSMNYEIIQTHPMYRSFTAALLQKELIGKNKLCIILLRTNGFMRKIYSVNSHIFKILFRNVL